MKKVLMTFGLAGMVAFASAQLTSKKGETYMPEADDWAIQFNASPIIGFFGNLANGSTNNNMSAMWANGTTQSITGKMFKDEETAMLAQIRIGMNSTSQDSLVAKAGSTTGEQVTNTTKTSATNIVLGGGMEKRRGSTRLQGVYGGMAWIGLGSNKTTYEYGNSLADDGSQMTENKQGGTFSFGLQGFIGAEYFIVPKISVGAMYTWGLAMSSTGEGQSTTKVDGAADVVNKTAGNSSFGLDTGNNGGQLTLSVHF